MLLNIAIDACTGAVPIVGDLFDFANKSNRRNLELLKGQSSDPSQRTHLTNLLLLGVGLLLLVACVGLPIWSGSCCSRRFSAEPAKPLPERARLLA
jgi:hypothetical protein